MRARWADPAGGFGGDIARSAYDPDHAYALPVREGYPYLLREADAIRASGVRFVDATELFVDETETVYRDMCCHFNEAGKQRLAALVAHEALDALGL